MTDSARIEIVQKAVDEIPPEILPYEQVKALYEIARELALAREAGRL